MAARRAPKHRFSVEYHHHAPVTLLSPRQYLARLGFRFDETIIQCGLHRGTVTGKGVITERSPFSIAAEEDPATAFHLEQRQGDGKPSTKNAGALTSPGAGQANALKEHNAQHSMSMSMLEVSSGAMRFKL